MSDQGYLPVIRQEFRRLEEIAERAMAQLEDAQYFQNLDSGNGSEDNSVAVVVKHMSGNMLSRWRDFLTTDGEKSDRNRDGEFELGEADTRGELTDAWEAGWACLFGAIDPLEESDLQRTITIRGEPHSVLQAISRQLSHYAYHVGQIVFIAKHLAGVRWQTLSIAKGESQSSNEVPDSYLGTSES